MDRKEIEGLHGQFNNAAQALVNAHHADTLALGEQLKTAEKWLDTLGQIKANALAHVDEVEKGLHQHLDESFKGLRTSMADTFDELILRDGGFAKSLRDRLHSMNGAGPEAAP